MARIRKHRWAAILSLAGAALGVSWSASAQQTADWPAQRRAEFARWQSAHPDVGGAIEGLKQRTAALVLSAGPASPDIAAAPVIRRVPDAPTEVWDDPLAPSMVVVPAGSYTMGSPATEQGRLGNEGPQRRVTINYAFAVGKYPVTRDEYAAFVSETKRPDGATCQVSVDGNPFVQIPGFTWRSPGFAQTGRDPVVCVSWSDAQAYVSWLSARTGKRYRLLSESEWEYAARAGTMTARYWGDAPSHDAANYGAEPTAGGLAAGARAGRDQWINTSPVGSFPPNPFGLYDMIGNAWSWVQDCFLPSYIPPTDGSAIGCTARSPRGAGWNNGANLTRSAYRYGAAAPLRGSTIGFRVARSL